MKPPFTYFGGKTSIAPRIAALLPPHEHYVEPFAGSLAVLLAKKPSPMETVNDLDGDLMNFWRVLRDREAEFVRACALTPHSRAEAQQAQRNDREGLDDVERARRLWVRLTQCRGGHTQRRTGWRYYQDPRHSHSSMPDYLDAYVSRIAAAAARLRNVSLECLPAAEIIQRYGRHPECLIYADPPYPASVRTWTNDVAYGHEMYAEAEHRELAGALKAARAAVVLSGYDSPLYAGLYAGWQRHEIPVFTGNATAGQRRRIEVLWSNRPFPQGSLFDEEVPA